MSDTFRYCVKTAKHDVDIFTTRCS